ncbi:MAG: curli assembly protein CsgF [Methyloligellaceae bacterium]
MLQRLSVLLFVCTQVVLVQSVSAGDLVYTPLNPSFGGSSFNSAHLLATAEAQKPKEKPKATSSSQSSSERFIRLLESRLYSSLATAVSEAIFGDSAQPSGTITFDTQQVAYTNNGTEIQLTITDFATGQVTNITVPSLVTP